ncbi:MAG: tetratricopeptide repeat protein [Ignavibacteria bacterium]|nr:tetratricopeptide repeat protein [Ignavibacteria bacterium]
MKSFKKNFVFLSGLFAVIVLIGFIGCSSPELTTGKLAFAQRDFVKAEENLRIGLQTDKNDAEGWYMLGVCQTELEKYDQAKESFQNSLKISNVYADELFDYWLLKYKTSVDKFNNAVGKDSATTYKNLAEAIKYATAASTIIPDSLESYRIMGDSYYYMKQYDNAIKYYSIPYSKSNNESDAINLAKAYYKSGLEKRLDNQYDESIAVFEKAIELNNLPKDNIYYESSLLNIGINYYQEALEISKTEGGDYKSKLAEAVKYFEPLKSSANKDFLKDLYEYLYNSYQALGDEAKADEIMKLKEELIKQ